MKKLLIALMSLLGISGIAGAQAPQQTTVKHPDWSRDAVIYEVNVRQYTPEGTFNAFAKELPRLKDLGVDILWFMPIHPISELNRKGGLGSYYAVADYKGVNPQFGSIDDFRAVVKKAHDLGMKVIIDWVPNHTGCDNAWTKDHPEYYARNEKGEMYGPFDWTDTYKLDYSNPGTRAAMIDAMQYWLREADIDGFRCDVAGQVPTSFWNECRPALESVKSDIFMLAEAPDAELMEHAFDMDYNWPQKDLFNRIANAAGQYTYVAPGETEIHKIGTNNAVDINELIAKQAATYPGDSFMMNMITNHDLNSWEGTEFERYGDLVDAMAVLMYTIPGMPLIYTGQETGMNRAFEFFVKDTAPQWQPTNKYFDFYKKLNALKHSRKELAAGNAGGSYEPINAGSPDIVMFKRVKDGKTTVVGANLGKADVKVKVAKKQQPVLKGAKDYFTGADVKKLPAVLKPGEYFVYVID